MVGRTLVSMGYATEQDIIEALSLQQGMDRIDVTKINISQDALKLVSSDVARFYNVMPVRIEDGVLVVAMADPLNIQTLTTSARSRAWMCAARSVTPLT